jgi:hypothetical protein
VCAPHRLAAQAETVPAHHPVYTFLKRMEVRGMVGHYFDALLPLSRSNIGALLVEAATHAPALTRAERDRLEDFRAEFRPETDSTMEGFLSVFDADAPGVGSGPATMLEHGEHHLYIRRDSLFTLFVNGFLTVDGRAISGDALGRANAAYVQFGGGVRGTILDHLGYFLRATNAQFWGSRELLERDPVISQSYALGTLDAQNFDVAEGGVRYQATPVSVQVGRERVLWGNGADQQMILSANPRVFDFIRADVEYRSFKYSFLHAWLLGRRSSIAFVLPSDSSAVFGEPVVADKYFAGHRLECSIGGAVDIGAQEMVVYSNRGPDLAYLNPVTLIESAQRSREERDNVLWAFDLQTRFLPGLQATGTIVFDDLHLAQFFDDFWYNRYAYQAGLIATDPLGVADVTLIAEYTRVEPFTFAHNRSRDNDFGSLGAILGPRIGPNADSWFVRADYEPFWNLRLSARVLFSRKGENVVDADGRLIRNVGGDILQPHRASDPERRRFLDGIRVNSTTVDLLATWEPRNQLWLDAAYSGEFIRRPASGASASNHTVIVRVRTTL